MPENCAAEPWSRRDVLSTGGRAAVSAGLLSPTTWGEQNSDERILVGIYVFGAGLSANEANPRPVGETIHPALSALSHLEGAKRIQVVPANRTEHQYSHLRFLPRAFVAPAWTAGQHSYTFDESFTLSTSTSVEGAQFENPTLRSAISRAPGLDVRFPQSDLGRKMEAIARLLTQVPSLGLKRVSILAQCNCWSPGMDDQRVALMTDLAEALAAFDRFTTKMNWNGRVTTYTDSEGPLGLTGAEGDDTHLVINAGAATTLAGRHDAVLARAAGLG